MADKMNCTERDKLI